MAVVVLSVKVRCQVRYTSRTKVLTNSVVIVSLIIVILDSPPNSKQVQDVSKDNKDYRFIMLKLLF